MFKVEFDTSNAAFEDGGEGEVARILRVLAHQVDAGYKFGPVYDCNGNTVGKWSWDDHR